MSDISDYSLDNLPEKVTVIPMSIPDEVLNRAEGDYEKADEHVYVRRDEDHVVLRDIYGAGETIDRLYDAINGGAKEINIVGLCAAREGDYEPGDILEPSEVHGVDTFGTSTDPKYVREPEQFPIQEIIDGETKHASVPAVHYDASDYVRENDIESVEMETAAAMRIAEGGERVDLNREDVRDVSVSAAYSVFDTYDEEMSQEAVWDNSEMTFEEAKEIACDSAAKAVDRLAAL